jgi:starvation-inducible DNA-binding protein
MIRQCGEQVKNVNTGRKTMAKETVTETRVNARGQRETGTDLTHEGVTEITAVLRLLLADGFALYFKTKNFHWHMTGQHFRDYHLLLDEHAEQIFAMTDDIAERDRSAIYPDASA